jgi:hypothetical protein
MDVVITSSCGLYCTGALFVVLASGVLACFMLLL